MYEFPAMLDPAERWPRGSYEWSERMAARLQLASRVVDQTTSAQLKKLVIDIVGGEVWRIFPKPPNGPAGTPQDFCLNTTGRTWEGLIADINYHLPQMEAQELEAHLKIANAIAQNGNRSQGARTDLLHCNTVKLGKMDAAHILRRLVRSNKSELADRVARGELSANAAAIEAGFRKKLTPYQQAERLVQTKLSPPELRKLAKMIEQRLKET